MSSPRASSQGVLRRFSRKLERAHFRRAPCGPSLTDLPSFRSGVFVCWRPRASAMPPPARSLQVLPIVAASSTLRAARTSSWRDSRLLAAFLKVVAVTGQSQSARVPARHQCSG